MTTNRRAKRDARARKAVTGESYTAARRRTGRSHSRHFAPDHCANCMQWLPQQIEGLFCSELCRQTASVVRYWRRIVRDGRIEKPDVLHALKTQVAHLLAGGYHSRERRLSRTIREQVWTRDRGLCRECGAQGEEIDHIHDDSPALSNLQLLCARCHQRKTAARMAPASPGQQQMVDKLWRERVAPKAAILLCDDGDEWPTVERQLRRERRERLLEELAQYGYDRRGFPGYSWAEMWDFVLDEDDEDDYDEDDFEAHGIDDDSGYGPDSYFAHAMAKDD